jgi:hypothetical protein
MYVKRNTEARSRNNCCCEKAISITYSESVCSISFPAFEAHAPYYIVSYSLSGCTRFFHIITLTTQLSEKVIEHKTHILTFSTAFI